MEEGVIAGRRESPQGVRETGAHADEYETVFRWYNAGMQSRRWLGAGLLAAGLLAGSGTAGAQESRTLLSLTVGIQPVFAYGAVEDYVPGVNDFPVTPAHRPILAGLSFGRLSGRWLFELEARWTASSRVVLEDPSDGDTVEIPTSARASACLAVFFLPLKGRIRPYLGGTAGVDVILAGETASNLAGRIRDPHLQSGFQGPFRPHRPGRRRAPDRLGRADRRSSGRPLCLGAGSAATRPRLAGDVILDSSSLAFSSS